VTRLITTLGSLSLDQVQRILPHEHIFTDTRQGWPAGFGQGHPDDVLARVAPALEELKDQGFNVLVECTPVGVGRRPDILASVSQRSGFAFTAATGIYREPWVPPWAQQASEDELRDWMIAELQDKMENTTVRAGWIKLSAGDDGITDTEAKILRAAAQASAATGALIGSHTIKGTVVQDQLDILEDAGGSPSRFLWIHAQNETDTSYHHRAAQRGAWLEFDAIGTAPDDSEYIRLLRHFIDAGWAGQLLISQDRGWYDPADPNGHHFRSYSYLGRSFLPKLRQDGLDAYVEQLTRINPFRAFAR